LYFALKKDFKKCVFLTHTIRHLPVIIQYQKYLWFQYSIGCHFNLSSDSSRKQTNRQWRGLD